MNRIKKLDDIIENYKKTAREKDIVICGRFKDDVYNYLNIYKKLHFICKNIYRANNANLYDHKKYYILDTDSGLFDFINKENEIPAWLNTPEYEVRK